MGNDAQPAARRLLKVQIDDQLETDRIMNDLMDEMHRPDFDSLWNEPKTLMKLTSSGLFFRRSNRAYA